MKEQRQASDYIFDEIRRNAEHPKWSIKIKMLRTSLTSKLLLLFLLAVLPVNLVTLYITSVVARSYEERAAEAYEFQLNLYTQSTADIFEDINQELRNLMSMEHLITLTKGSASDPSLDMQHLITDLHDSSIWNKLPGMSYVWDHERDILSFSTQGGKYSSTGSIYREEEELIRGKCKDGLYSGGREIIQIKNRFYIILPFDYPRFSMGILIDCGAILDHYQADQTDPVGEVYLTDEEGKAIAFISEQGILPADDRSVPYSQKDLLISKPIGFGNYEIAHHISQTDYQKRLPQLLVLLRILSAIGFLAIPLLILGVLHYVIHPLQRMAEGMEEVEAGNLEYQVEGCTGSYQLDYLYACFNKMVRQIHHLITDSYEREIEKLQTDAINMRLQVNQHMLLNFLNTIYSLASAGKVDQISEFTQLLMKYFRYVLRQNIALVKVSEEIHFVEDYVRLQQVRFPDSFSFSYSVDERAEDILIPQLLIENFVENSIKYGLIMGKEIEILLNIRLEENRLMISVCDSGNGMEEGIAEKLNAGQVIENRTGKHIGIWNCRRRLKYYYGSDYQMRINSRPQEGTQIWIEIPDRTLEKEDVIRQTAMEG